MDDKNKKPTGTRGVARGSARRTAGKRMGAGRRRIVATRRNRRAGPGVNRRNRLARAQGSLRNNRQGQKGRFLRRNRRFGFRRQRRNLRLRKVFVGGLPRYVDNRRLYGLFRNEGRIVGCKIIYDRLGLSRGFGELEFNNPRDAWRTIQRWNNTSYKGNNLRVEYKKRRRRTIRNRSFVNNNYRRNYGFSSSRGGFRGNRGSYGGRFRGNRY